MTDDIFGSWRNLCLCLHARFSNPNHLSGFTDKRGVATRVLANWPLHAARWSSLYFSINVLTMLKVVGVSGEGTALSKRMEEAANASSCAARLRR